jgi:hypothetical protein
MKKNTQLSGLLALEEQRRVDLDDYFNTSSRKQAKKTNTARKLLHANDTYLPPHTCTQFWSGARNALHSVHCKRCNMSTQQFKTKKKKQSNTHMKQNRKQLLDNEYQQLRSTHNRVRFRSDLNNPSNNNNNEEEDELRRQQQEEEEEALRQKVLLKQQVRSMLDKYLRDKYTSVSVQTVPPSPASPVKQKKKKKDIPSLVTDFQYGIHWIPQEISISNNR